MMIALLAFAGSIGSFAFGYHAGWSDRARRERHINHALLDAALQAFYDRASHE